MAVHSFFDFGLHITINSLIFIALIVIATVDERVEELQVRKIHRRSNAEEGGLMARPAL